VEAPNLLKMLLFANFERIFKKMQWKLRDIRHFLSGRASNRLDLRLKLSFIISAVR